MPCTERFCIPATGLTQQGTFACMQAPQVRTSIPAAISIALVLAAAPAPDVEAVLELLAHIIAALVVRHGADWRHNKCVLHSACGHDMVLCNTTSHLM